jgi:hypothetical protein
VSGGYSHLLISAISTRQAMYQKMGFHALGPAVPEGKASFVPMLMTLLRDANAAHAVQRGLPPHAGARPALGKRSG